MNLNLHLLLNLDIDELLAFYSSVCGTLYIHQEMLPHPQLKKVYTDLEALLRNAICSAMPAEDAAEILQHIQKEIDRARAGMQEALKYVAEQKGIIKRFEA